MTLVKGTEINKNVGSFVRSFLYAVLMASLWHLLPIQSGSCN